MTEKIPYDPSRTALYSPEERETLFEAGRHYEPPQIAVEAARLAYYRAESFDKQKRRLAAALERAGFEAPTLFNNYDTGTQGFGAWNPDRKIALLSFRGTQPDDASDLATDADFRFTPWGTSGAEVHKGFCEAYKSVENPVKTWLGKCPDRTSFIITGHSLGAALATLAATELQPTMLVTLGCPRVGDEKFVKLLQGFEVHRLVDCCDEITEVPPEFLGYRHPPQVTYITHTGELLQNPSEDVMEDDQSAGRRLYRREYAWKPGTVLTRHLADHAPVNYARGLIGQTIHDQKDSTL